MTAPSAENWNVVSSARPSAELAPAELRNIYAKAPLGLCHVDADLRFVSMNDQLAAMMGRPAAEYIGRTIREVVPDYADLVEPIYHRVLTTGEPVLDFEISGPSAADPGVTRSWLCTYCPMADERSRVIGVSVIVEDITARRAAEGRLREASETLRQSNEFLHVIGARLPQAMFFQVLHEPGGGFSFKYASEGAEAVTGLTAADLLAHPNAILDIIVDEDRPRLLDGMARSLATLEPLDVVCRRRGPDGDVSWMHFRSALRQLPDGYCLCEGLVLDITARTRAEDALRDSEARTEAILSALPDMMFVISTQGVYLDAHFHNANDLAAPPDQFIGRTVTDVLPEPVARQIMRGFDQVQLEGSAIAEYSLTVAGQLHHYEARMVRLGADKILTIVRDLTESKRAQHEAQHNRIELAHLSRVTMLGEITASIAHELNQPLAAVMSNAQAAQRLLANGSAPTADLQEILADIVHADQRAGDVIRRLRVWLGRDRPMLRPLDVNQVILDVERLIRSELLLRHVRLSLSLDPSLPNVSADLVQLQQVILNLALNAMEAMDGIPNQERLLSIQTSSAADAVLVAVTDRGPGIGAVHMDRLFDAFFSTKPTGLGIGLRICASIVDAHGGRIWAANNAAGGATFSFTLPAGVGE